MSDSVRRRGSSWRGPSLLCALGTLVLTLGVSAAAEDGSRNETWLPGVIGDIARQEYDFTRQEGPGESVPGAAWHAPNRAHGIRAFLAGGRLVVIPRTGENPSWELTSRFVRTGRGAATDAAAGAGADASLVERVSGHRIEVDRGALTEWVLNNPSGLAQGFTLREPPRGERDESTASPAWIELALGGSVTPAIATDGRAVDFVTGRGARVLHAALSVHDASGRALSSRIEACEGGIRLVIDDRDTAYPVLASLLATSASWSAQGDQAESRFGYAVASAGDVNADGYADVIVGAHAYDNGQADEGRAYLYLGTASGLASAAAWTAEGDQAGAVFGVSVGTAGDVNGDGYADVIVGAQLYDNGQNGEGRAFVYHGSAAGLTAAPAWTAESDQADALFGASVGTAGDVNGDGYSDVVVGAPEAANGQAEEGRVFVYHGSSAGLAATPNWTAESNQAQAEFGSAVASAGDVNGDGYADLIVGAPAYDGGQVDEGRAFAYFGTSSGLAAGPAWTAEADQADARFAARVAPAGDLNGDGYADVLVGAPQYDDDEAGEGRVFAWHGSATGLAAAPASVLDGNQIGAALGSAIFTAGDVNADGFADAIVGAPGYGNGEAGEGRALVYHGSAAGLSASPSWEVESDQAGASLGAAVATAGDVNGDGYADVIASATSYDDGQTNEGRAFVYHGSAAGPSTSAGWSVDADQGGANLGISVATAGDVNADGFADIIVGAYLYDAGQTNEGRVFVFHGSAAGPADVPSWTAENDQPLSSFGFSVGTAGDVNGDGHDDVIIGATRHDNGEEEEGGAWVYLGSVAGLAPSAAWTAESNLEYSRFGSSVGTAGDVNGDGYADVIVGARFFGEAQAEKGKAYVYHGSATGLSPAANWSVEGTRNNQQFASSVGGAGDVNGDGYSDVIVGSSGTNAAYAFYGSAAGLATVAGWTVQTAQAGAAFGSSAKGAGDVNGDGYADVIVGAPSFDGGHVDGGAAFVYHGSAAGPATNPAWTAEADQAGASFGTAVGAAGDVNGDGFADVIVGAPLYDGVESGEGRAFVFLGSSSGLAAGAAWTAESDQAAANLGRAVAGAGDVNGDGYADVIAGAPTFDDAQADTGRAYVFYGNGAGTALRPRQLRGADARPIAWRGRSDGQGFRLALNGRSPFGRGRVKLQWEVKPFGASLDGSGVQAQNVWSDSGTTGAPLDAAVGGLDGNRLHHWRVRTVHDPVTTPFLAHGPWLTLPWGGWQEPMLRTSTAAAPGSVHTLLVARSGADVNLSWTPACPAPDYAIYEGTLGDFASHGARVCTTGGDTSSTFTPPGGSVYYLVVPLNASAEGSYGTTSSGSERPAGSPACRPQLLGGC